MRLRSNDRCWCGSGAKHKHCHGDTSRLRRARVELGRVTPPLPVPDTIARPDYVVNGSVGTSRQPTRHDADAVARMRVAGAVAAEVLWRAGQAVRVGVTTNELDELAHATYIELGAYPSTLHYKGFTKSMCTSVNGIVCHGIPDDRPLANGDIVNLDVTAFIDGMHGDTSATFCVGDVDEPTRGLVETTREATLRGIAAIRAHQPAQRIAQAIEPFAHSRGYGVVREYGGHGIGETFHAAPHIHHCVERGDHVVLEPGMSLTVEPMLTTGRAGFTRLDDGWTERLDDDMPSAQFEHTVLVTADGVEILTVTADGRTAVGVI